MTRHAKFPALPVDGVLPEVVGALEGRQAAVLLAPPGAGKTTRLPPALAGAPWLRAPHRTIVVLQPRRVAARAAAARIAEEHGWRVGEEVGYQVRFDNRTGPRTRIRVVTEGILARRLQADPFLEGVGCVVLDEFHERSIHTDLALAMLREVQTSVREDLRLVVMSATMEAAPVAAFLGGAPVIESKGRIFPVEVSWLERPDPAPAWELAAAAVRRAVAAGADGRAGDRADDAVGHVLVFLPGIGEIRRVAERLDPHDGDIHLLHSSVPADEQDAALRPSARRKIILATNIAETSLTIDGVRTVIDTGLARVPINDPRLGIDRLDTRRISRASAAQRAGRAGRTAPGRCVRLWTRTEEATMEERETPEIHRVDLAPTLLALHAYGVRDVGAFGWFEAPRDEARERAEHLLWLLGATESEGGAMTPRGRRLAALPVHPRLGALLLAGAEEGVAREAATLAAMLSEGDPAALGGGAARRRAADWTGRSDLLERLAALEGAPGHEPVERGAARNIERLRDELLRLMRDE